MSADDPITSLGLWCPDGGDFYVCGEAALNFIGCCTSNPCADGSGECPSRDLREASFSADRYANIPAQSCDDNRRENVWYTCRDNDPPFLGCCASVPCGSGCPRDHLIQAVLSDEEVNRLAFLPSSASSTSVTTPPSNTAASAQSSTPTSAPPASSSLSTGAIAGIAVAGVAVLIIVGALLWWYRRRARKSNEGHDPSGEHPGPEMAYPGSIPNSPAPHDGRDSHISSATTAIPNSYYSTPTSPDFPKAFAQYPNPHHQPPPHSPPPPSLYSQYTDSDNGYMGGHPRHVSHMSATSDPNMALYPVSEIDGVERGSYRVELPGDDGAGPMNGRR